MIEIIFIALAVIVCILMLGFFIKTVINIRNQSVDSFKKNRQVNRDRIKHNQ